MKGGDNTQSCWKLDGPIANLQGALSGRLNLERPDIGLFDVQCNALPLAGEMLCILRESDAENGSGWPLPVSETYLRGDDLIAAYKPTADWPYRPQIYWSGCSAREDASAGAVAVMISLQTDLLDTWPSIHVRSRIAAGETHLIEWQNRADIRVNRVIDSQSVPPSAEISCVLRRIAGTTLSYIEAMRGSDFRQLQLQVNATLSESRWLLFSDFLEKGVIRRSQLQCALIHRDGDIDAAGELCAAMANSEPPLTT